jgi:hypothetical protein
MLKFLDGHSYSVVFVFIFRNLAMWQKFSMSQTFSMFQKNLEKVWEIEKCLYLCFLLNKISKKPGKNNRVPQHLSRFFWKIHRKSLGHKKMLGLCHFLPSFFWIWLCYRIFLCSRLFLCFKKTWKKFGT